MLMVFDAVYQKKRDTNVSPVIIKIYVPTLALSKSGIWVEVLNFLSAWYTSSPCFIYTFKYKNSYTKCQLIFYSFLTFFETTIFIHSIYYQK